MIQLVDDSGRVCWLGTQCAEHLGVQLTTWSSYVSRGQAPQAVGEFLGRRVWLASDVERWNRARRGHTH